jgi:hypothetical protein
MSKSRDKTGRGRQVGPKARDLPERIFRGSAQLLVPLYGGFRRQYTNSGQEK